MLLSPTHRCQQLATCTMYSACHAHENYPMSCNCRAQPSKSDDKFLAPARKNLAPKTGMACRQEQSLRHHFVRDSLRKWKIKELLHCKGQANLFDQQPDLSEPGSPFPDCRLGYLTACLTGVAPGYRAQDRQPEGRRHNHQPIPKLAGHGCNHLESTPSLNNYRKNPKCAVKPLRRNKTISA
jgi:hypothetical protein